jgi:hypothetical protein
MAEYGIQRKEKRPGYYEYRYVCPKCGKTSGSYGKSEVEEAYRVHELSVHDLPSRRQRPLKRK